MYIILFKVLYGYDLLIKIYFKDETFKGEILLIKKYSKIIIKA